VLYRCPPEPGRSIFDCADELAVAVPTSCGRSGICHECIVEIRAGIDALSARTEPESFLRGHYRLACQARIEKSEPAVEFTLLRRRPQILTAAPYRPIDVDSPVTRRSGRVFLEDEPLDEDRGRLLAWTWRPARLCSAAPSKTPSVSAAATS
jgi:ferredoxin